MNTADLGQASGYFGIWFAYFALAAAQFYAGNRLRSGQGARWPAILSQAVTIAFIMAILYLTTRLGAAPG